MTSQSSWSERAIATIRSAPAPPYAEGKPVRRVVVVVGRRSGQPHPFGINVSQIGGTLYLCSATRRRDWVRNLIHARRCIVERDGPDNADTEYTPVLIEGDEAANVLATYLPQSGYQDPELPFSPDAPADQIVPHTATTAVIRLDPR